MSLICLIFYMYICGKVTLHDFSSHSTLLVKYNNNNNNFLENFAMKYCWREHYIFIYYLKKCSIIYYRNMEIIMENVQA